MLIHLTPRFYAQPGFAFRISECRLISLQVKELGVELKSTELVSRKPFPNKNHWVASRKIGRRAVEGILIDTPAHVHTFTSLARWLVNEEHIVEHEIEYTVLDQKFDSVSDKTMLWWGGQMHGIQYESRWPEGLAAQGRAQPFVELFPKKEEPPSLVHPFTDTLTDEGLIKLRQEKLAMPTLQRERITETDWSDRMPSEQTAILCQPC